MTREDLDWLIAALPCGNVLPRLRAMGVEMAETKTTTTPRVKIHTPECKAARVASAVDRVLGPCICPPRAGHTPGPWAADLRDRETEWPTIRDSTGNPVAFTPTGLQGLAEAQANARLIAAAPEMRAFIETTADRACECDLNPHGCPVCDARALIARIDGEGV